MSELFQVEYEDIERAIFFDRSHRSTVMPRFTPQGWWECDVCEITEAGYMREYEIKMSRSDFRVDAQKEREKWAPGDLWTPGAIPKVENKHALLSAGDTRGPTMFYFCTPSGLLKIEEVPTWAGLIEVRPFGGWPILSETKKAPRLHNAKADDAIRRQMIGAAYHRLHAVWTDAYHQRISARQRPAA